MESIWVEGSAIRKREPLSGDIEVPVVYGAGGERTGCAWGIYGEGSDKAPLAIWKGKSDS